VRVCGRYSTSFSRTSGCVERSDEVCAVVENVGLPARVVCVCVSLRVRVCTFVCARLLNVVNQLVVLTSLMPD
jgi:hypothetical protein